MPDRLWPGGGEPPARRHRAGVTGRATAWTGTTLDMFIGRGGEMSRALGVLRRTAHSGQGAVLAVDGEPGIGKSAFFRAVAEQAQRLGYVVGAGKAEEIDQIAPGAPLLVALRSGTRPVLAEKAFAELASLYARQVWLVDRIAGLLEERALGTPVLIGVDDLQWADGLTRFALRVLPARLAGSSVVWLLAGRSGAEDVVRQMTSSAVQPLDVERIGLGPLDADSLADLARDRLGAPPSTRTADLLRGVGGNPFYAVQLLDAVARRQGVDSDEDELPAEIILGVRRRMPLLAPELVRLLRLCAVWGRTITADQAAALLGDLPVAVVLDAAQQGVVEGLLRREDRLVSFRHDLLREAVYADIGAAERITSHRACGRFLLDTGADPMAAVPHFQAGVVVGDDEAVAVLRAAAADAVGSVPDVAADLARQAFAMTDPDGEHWLDVGRECAELLIGVHRGRAALEIVDLLLRRVADPEEVARLQVIATGALWSMNRLVEIGRRVEDALASDAVSPLLRTRLTAAGTLSLVQTGTSADAATAADAALSNARRCGDEPAQRFALLALSVVARQEGRHSEAHRRIRSLRALAGAEHLAEEVRALQMLDRYDEAAILLAQARRDLPDGIDAPPDLVHAQMWQDVNLGRIEDAEAQAHTLVRLSDELGEHVSTLDAGSVLSFTAMVRGDVTQARERLAAYSRPGPDDVAIRATAVALMRGWIALVTGDVAESVSAYRPLLDTARTSREYWPWFPLWMRPFVLAGVAAGDHAFAAEAASIAATGAERNPGVASFAGLALQTRGLVDDDPDLLGQAVDVLRTSPRPLLLASALADHGTALLTTDRDTAIGRLDAARGVYERVGATLPGAAVARAMVDAGARPTRPARGGPRPPSGWAALTDTELKVAELVGAGHSNRSAAADLGVSVNTVGTHLRAVFAKLDVRSRVQLANVLHERA